MDRREFLTGSVGALIGAGSGEAAAPTPSDAESLLDPSYAHELLVDLEAVDLIMIRRLLKAHNEHGDGLSFAFWRNGMGLPCRRSVNLSKPDMRSQFHMRGPVPFKIHVTFDEADGIGLILQVVLGERARVRAYRETGPALPGAAGQPIHFDRIVVVTKRLDRRPV